MMRGDQAADTRAGSCVLGEMRCARKQANGCPMRRRCALSECCSLDCAVGGKKPPPDGRECDVNYKPGEDS